jgi:hypothetical protein
LGSQKIAPEDVDQTVQTLEVMKASVNKEIDKSDDLPDGETKDALKEIVDELVASLTATVKTGKSDGGGALLLAEKSATLIVGIYCAEPNDVEKALKKLAGVAAKEPDFPAIKFDAAKHGDIRFHTVQVPVPDDNKKLIEVLGPSVEVAVGFGPKSIYVGAGTNCLAQLKKAIDASKAGATKTVPPASFDVALRPIIAFASQVDDSPVIKEVAAELAKQPGADHVTGMLKSIKNGAAYRIEIQEGVLMAIGAAVKSAKANGGGDITIEEAEIEEVEDR